MHILNKITNPNKSGAALTKNQQQKTNNKNLEKDFFLLDVRTPQEFNESHISNSINIPLDQLSQNLPQLKKIKQPILIICRSGARAHITQEYLEEQKIKNTKVLEGGILKHGTNPIN